MMTAAAQALKSQPDADHPAVVFFHLSRTFFSLQSTHYPVLWHCRLLLSTWDLLASLWAPAKNTPAPAQLPVTYAAVPGLMRLSAAMMHVINLERPAVTATAAPGLGPATEERSAADTLYGTVLQVAKVFKSVSWAIIGDNVDGQQRDLQAFASVLPEFSTVLSTIITFEADSLLLQQQLLTTKTAQGTRGSHAASMETHSTSTSSTSSRGNRAHGVAGGEAASGSSSTTGRQDSKAGSSNAGGSDCITVIRKVKKACRAMPECIDTLLLAQGVDNEILVWVTAAFRKHTKFDALEVSAASFLQLANWIASRPRASKHHMQPLQQQMLLVSAVLLRHAAAASKVVSNPQQAKECSHLADVARQIIQAWLSLTKHPYVPTAEGPWLPGAQPVQWLQQVVSDIQTVLGSFLQVCRLPPGISTMTAPGSNKKNSPWQQLDCWQQQKRSLDSFNEPRECQVLGPGACSDADAGAQRAAHQLRHTCKHPLRC
jgi:hypothetical protein